MNSWKKKVWLFFASMKTGLFLLGLIVLVSAAGTLFSANIYGSLLFKIVFGLLAINLGVCSINRFNIAYRCTFYPSIPRNIHAVPPKIRSFIAGKSGALRMQLEKVLNARGYGMVSMETDAGWAFAALKHRWGYWGTFIVHIAFIMIIVGIMMGNFGFSGKLTAWQGEVVSFNKINFNKGCADKNYSIRINSIEDRFMPNGERDNWYTNISIIRDDKELARGTLSVNHPFKYDGIYYYQSSYMDYARITIAKEGETFEGIVPLGLVAGEEKVATGMQYRFGQEIGNSKIYVKGLKLQNQPYVYMQIYDRKVEKEPAMLKLSQGQTGTIFDQTRITLPELTNSTGLEIKADPGVSVVWLGSGLLLAGLILSFYRRPLLVSGVFTGKEEEGILLLGMSTGRMQRYNKTDFDHIIKFLNQL